MPNLRTANTLALLATWVSLAVLVGLVGNAWLNLSSFDQLARRNVQTIRMLGEVVHLDEVLTMSARMAATTGDERWATRYRESEPKLERAIQAVLGQADSADRAAFARTDMANQTLVALETECLSLAESGRLTEAKERVFGPEYERHKTEYQAGVNTLRRSLEAKIEAGSNSVKARIAWGSMSAVFGVAAVIWLWRESNARAKREESLREDLRLVTRHQTIDRLASNLAHELHQPITAIAHYSDAAAHHIPADRPELSESVAGISVQARRAAEILGRVRVFARKHPVRRERLDLNEVVRQAEYLVAYEARFHGVVIETDLSRHPLNAVGDPVLLQQVFVNILVNAIEACASVRGPGRIVVSTAGEPEANIVTIADNGPGIPLGRLPGLFEVSGSTKPDGLGMGLAIARDIVGSVGGSITVECGQPGAKFVVWIPRVEK